MKEIKDLETWKASNLDLIEEALEKHNKAIVLIAGASSSGKSYAGHALTEFLGENGHKTLTISTDSYNVGISNIVFNKVNKNHFDNQLKNADILKDIIKDAIINLEFNDKFSKNCLIEIGKKSKQYFESHETLTKYLNLLKQGFEKISFDETTVYNLPLVATDVQSLANNETIMSKEYSKKISEQQPTNKYISGKDYDVIILEGIYALDDSVTKILNGQNVISNFIMADEKTLFIRRVLRDSVFVPNTFTVKNYFQAVLPAYKKDILTKADKSDIIFANNMSFKELREGQVWSVHKRVKINNPNQIDNIIQNSKVISKIIFKDYFINSQPNPTAEESQLIFRVASYDGGKTFTPYGLVQKGIVKTRKDGKMIRPVNVFLNEEEMKTTFSNEKEFFDLIKDSDFKYIDQKTKQRTRLQYKEHDITIDKIKNDGTYIEWNGLDLKNEQQKGKIENFDMQIEK